MRTPVKKALKTHNVLDDTDSKYVINILTKSKQHLEDEGYIRVPNASLIHDTVTTLRERETETWFQWVKGHRGHPGNERANELANEGARKQIEYAKAAVEDAFGDRPTNERFWKSLRHKDITRNIRYILWMMVHNAYMVGMNWLQPNYKPEFQEQAYC
ncbi:hypothetical protein IW262DRAFT_1447889 [Armillaria fumosa]|nr:hypothetical protein IW262DRAFT_1447889 [Armillaria fumosa]